MMTLLGPECVSETSRSPSEAISQSKSSVTDRVASVRDIRQNARNRSRKSSWQGKARAHSDSLLLSITTV